MMKKWISILSFVPFIVYGADDGHEWKTVGNGRIVKQKEPKKKPDPSIPPAAVSGKAPIIKDAEEKKKKIRKRKKPKAPEKQLAQDVPADFVEKLPIMEMENAAGMEEKSPKPEDATVPASSSDLELIHKPLIQSNLEIDLSNWDLRDAEKKESFMRELMEKILDTSPSPETLVLMNLQIEEADPDTMVELVFRAVSAPGVKKVDLSGNRISYGTAMMITAAGGVNKKTVILTKAQVDQSAKEVFESHKARNVVWN